MTLNDGSCRLNKKGWNRNSALKLSTFDWLCDLPETVKATDFVEVQFKNTRKGYYINEDHLDLKKGDMVAVEAQPGHDIGEVTLVGLGNHFELWDQAKYMQFEQAELQKGLPPEVFDLVL